MILSQDAAARVEQVDIDYLEARIVALAQVTGNPYGAAIRRAGSARAFMVQAVPNPLFNHVMGLTANAVSELPELAQWYARHGKTTRVDVTPAQSSRELFTALAGQGLSQSGFYAALYADARPHAAREADGPIQVEPADPQEFARIYVEGFGFPSAHCNAMAVSVQVLAGRADVRFYRARIGASTAGVALLFLGENIGYLATAATLPDYRGRGIQSALIRHRLYAADDAGCDLTAGHTAAGSVSQRAMERSGLRLAYTKAIWSTPVA
ncbi:MAG TPA: GNAT family N-acetyltransferase [Streptosporangiaceae bacterium]|nr:GNAT family N-acetyltransferase [Streptosporangiaceae bacterium]